MKLENGMLLNERYLIESVIGQGGMSYVYRAEDQRMRRPVAIKLLKEEYCEDEEFIRKFQNEAQAAAKLNHPNIVAAYDVIDDDAAKLHYIVMELVEGITLKNYIQRKSRLNNRETIGIALQVIDGIEQAHKMGIVHRDIKPQNMIVSTDGVVKVADFGIARAATQQTVNATVMGSVHYISPEQARSGASDERSDIYSFGCTLYEMLTGRVPYDGDTSVSVMFSHLEDPVPRVSELVAEVYPALDLAVYKCMLKNPELRYQHIGELGEDLQRALEQPDGSFIEIPETVEDMRLPAAGRSDRANGKGSGQRETAEDGNQDVRGKMNMLYRGIAVACVGMIVLLLLFLVFQLFRILHSASQRETTAAQESMAESLTEPVNITISALETRLPNIIGKTVEEASVYLGDYGLRLRREGSEFSDSYPEGQIVSYPDGNYASGDTVPVTVSRGPLTLSFYDPAAPENLDMLHNIRFSELRKELEDRNIPFRYSMEFSDEVREGNVISTNKPDTGGAEELQIIVSQGSAKDRAVTPRLIGYSVEEAEALLQDASLQLGELHYAPSADMEYGIILGQSYEEGTILNKGTTVDITVSSGTGSAPQESRQSTRSYWYGSLNRTVKLGTGGPGIEGKMLVSIRLRQDINGESIYTSLQSARSYSLGTELQVVYSRIKGAEGIPTGTVEIVDAENDSILASYEVEFAP